MTVFKKNSSNFPLVILVSDFTSLALALVESLENNFCRVAVMSEDTDHWQKAFQKNNRNNLTSLFAKNFTPDLNEVNYLIYLYYSPVNANNERNFTTFQKKINLTKNLSVKYKPKTLFVFPYSQDKEVHSFISTQVKNIFADKNIYSGILYLGDVISLERETEKSFLLEKSVTDKMLTATSSEQLFYPISLEMTVEKIIKSLYSLGVYGKKTAIISKAFKAKDLQQILKKIGIKIDLQFENSKQENIQANVDEKMYLEENVEILIKNALGVIDTGFIEKDFYVKKIDGSNIKTPVVPKVKSRLKFTNTIVNFFKKWRVGIITLILLIFLSPFIFLTMSGIILFGGKKLFTSGNLKGSRVGLKTSLGLSRATGLYSMFLAKAPWIGNPYQQIFDLSEVLQKLNLIGLSGISSIESLFVLSSVVVGKEDYDFKTCSQQLFFELDLLSKELGFAQAEIQELEPLPTKITNIILGDIKINLWREKIMQMQKLSAEADIFFGKEKRVTYLILFQNNSILRATGGLIESFGLVTFNNGKFENMEIYDASSVDKNLVGIVEPSMAIKKYLNETEWYLRDSNWNADFPTSAAKAEWFLDKGMGRAVDGVVAFDIEFIKLILDKAGGVDLENVDGLVNSKNMHEVFGNFSQNNNYPELSGESSYTNLIRAVFSRDINFDNLANYKFMKSAYKNLNHKNVQLFLHDRNSQRVLAELNWDGAVRGETCFDNCYSDFLNLTESNVGDNSSHLIAEELELAIFLEEGLIKRKLTVFLENLGETSYEAYFRVLGNADSGFGQVEVFGTELKESLIPEVFAVSGYKEAGVLVEILPQETKAIIFSWESGSELNFNEEGKYTLYWRKQAGSNDRLVDMKVNVPGNVKIKEGGVLGLTEDGLYSYNTKLLEDFTASILW